MIELQSLGLSEYRQPIQLSADNLPSRLTAAFTEGSLTLRRPATMILTADPSATPGDYTVTLTATGREGRTETTRTTEIQLTLLAPDVTTVVGRILRGDDDLPIPGVRVQLGEHFATTDAAGFYQFIDPAVSGDQVILIDGDTANSESIHYPSRIPMPVMILPGTENRVLTSFLSPVDANRRFPITPGEAAEVTFAELPNYGLHIPEGVRLIGWDGTPITEINVRTASPDRLPIRPLPDGLTATTVYLYYFFREGGADPESPIPVTMPNEAGLAPGTKADLWYYDESPTPDPTSNQWRRQGTGTVSDDGLTITTDPGVGIPKFCCGASTFIVDLLEQLIPPTDGPCAGNPIDLATGTGSLFEDHSIGINGLFPAQLSCGYGSTKSTPGPFAPGTWLNTEWRLILGVASLGLVTPQGALYVLSEEAPGRYRVGPGNRPEAFGITARFGGDGSPIGYVDLPDGTVMEFDMINGRNGPLTRLIDIDGNTVTITRDNDHPLKLPIAVTDGAGRVYSIAYNEHDYIDSITDPAGRTQRYHYWDYAQSAGSDIPPVEGTPSGPVGITVLAGITDFAGLRTNYRWNRDYGESISKTGGKTKPTFNLYDEEGRITDQYFGTVHYELTIPSKCGPLPESWPEDYHPYGFHSTVVSFHYCAMNGVSGGGSSSGSMVALPIPVMAEPNLVYDGHHRFTYRTAGKKVIETDHINPRYFKTTYRFDGRNNNTRIVDALGRVTAKEYLATNSKLRRVIDPVGRDTWFTYDTNGNRNSVRDATGHTTLVDYDPVTNRPERIVDPLGRETQLVYDPKGHLIQATNAAGESADISYTARGEIATISDPAGSTWHFAYDTFGNLSALTDPEGRTSRYRYDAASRVVEAIDPLGRSTRYAYDPMDRVTQVINPKGETTTLTYRLDGQLESVTDAKGAVIESNTYDLMKRLTSRTDALGNEELFTYDRNDNLITYTDAAGQVTTFGYDALDRLIGMVDADGRSTEYDYDLAGNLTWVSDSLTGETRYDYDTLDRLTREVSPQGTVEYAYDAAGQLTWRRVNGLSNTHYSYDLAGRVTEIDHDGRSAYFRYDAAGRLTEKELPNGIIQRYDYSAAGDLLAIAYVDSSGGEVDRIDYEYDEAGNRVRRNRARTASTGETPFTAVYDDANRMLSYNGYALSYDATGNLIGRETAQGPVSYSWDARGQLVAIDGPNGTASFRYDHQGRRIERTVNGVTTGYLYDGAQAIAELAGSALGTTYHTGLMIDEVLGRYSAAGDRQVLSDALGSVVGLADEGGAVTDEYAYSAFGESGHVGPDERNSLGYTGREEDGTGLYYYRARYYDPGLKRFISVDPIGLMGGINVYAYVWNAPTFLRDPFGLDPGSGSGSGGAKQCGSGGYSARNFVNAKPKGVASVAIYVPAGGYWMWVPAGVAAKVASAVQMQVPIGTLNDPPSAVQALSMASMATGITGLITGSVRLGTASLATSAVTAVVEPNENNITALAIGAASRGAVQPLLGQEAATTIDAYSTIIQAGNLARDANE